MKPPYKDDEEFGLLRTYAFGTKVFRADKGIRPYIELQAGLARAHPRSLLFAIRPLPEDLEIGDSPTKPANGFGVGIVPGVEISLTRSLALDASVQFNAFNTDEYDLTPIGQPPASSGSIFGGRLGLSWVPNGGGAGKRDAWGVQKSYGWAIGGDARHQPRGLAPQRVQAQRELQPDQPAELVAQHRGRASTTTTTSSAPTSSTIPSTAAPTSTPRRANGHGFWVSSAYAVGGAFVWECCGETHPMSFNDMISTGIGGMALGEMMYRMSSKILDNSATGKGRFFREAGGVPGRPDPRVQPAWSPAAPPVRTTTPATPWTGVRREAAASSPWGRARSGAASPSARTPRRPATSSSATPTATPSTTSATSPTTRST